MYLDKIEIHGFKSFGDAVKLNIPKGITGVIGPNGSGKSNVADAIRWVLGEQSAKSLRGSKMEDIIFAGTEKRKSLGYAEVALTIKNPDETVRIAYTEIVIKRRVYRSGESEYFINGSSCRLKDVQELFMDTGIGKDGYSIIGQGQIDRVLSSKPEERRTLFEEAAGIYKYKVRRQEAERKLEKQRENLTRLQDIIGEIENRLSPLEREAGKTTQFLRLKDELKGIDINIFIYEIERLEKEIQELSCKMIATDEELKDKNTQYLSKCELNDSYKKQRDELYHQTENLIEAISEKEKDQERKQSQLTINAEKKVNIERLLEQVYEDQKNQTNAHESKIEKRSFLETKRTALELEKASKMAIIEQEEEKINLLMEELSHLEGSISESKQELFNKMREIDIFEAEVKKNDGVEAQLEYRKEQILEQIAILNSEIQHQEVSCKVLEKNQAEATEQQASLKSSLEAMEKDKGQLMSRKIQYENELNTVKQNKMQAERQYKWFEHLKEEHEGYFSSVKQVLNVVKGDPNKWQGIVGVVGELMEVPKDYEIAIVTALGGSIQNLVADKEDDAKNMIQVMKQRGISRVTFLPLDTIKPAFPMQEKGLSEEVGFLGLGSELISYDKKYENVISSLLGRILIVNDMKNASRIAKKYHYKYKIVTLEGEVFNSGGSLSGGSMKNQSNNLFSRAREMKELEQKLKHLAKEEEEKEKVLVMLTKELEEKLTQYESTEVRYIQVSDAIKNYGLEWEKNAHALKLTKNNQLQLITERNNIDESIEVIKQGKEQAEEKLRDLKATINDDELQIADLEKQLADSKGRREVLEKALTDKKISLSNTEQNINYMIDQMNELEADINGQDEKNAHLSETIECYQMEIQQLINENEKVKEVIKLLNEEVVIKQKERKQLDEQKVLLEQKQVQLSDEITTMSEQMNLLKEEKYRLENKKQNSELQKQNWGNSMWEQYELTFTHALPYRLENISITDLKKQSVDVRGQIKQIGNVNVNAVEEFRETKERYEFLTKQKEDIEKAEQSLIELINELMEQMKDIFITQFAIIAENFTHVFKELFGGGEAYLKLLDEENILESGIEIIAKPPGKKLQNMTLLSGGERTLTAISLIFGILKLKPSPFCVLDEIEAALDDANVLRFANYLESLSRETQFIVITHRKGTMERAHTLYGVTMQERGVSTILSIQLEDVSEYIDQKKTS